MATRGHYLHCEIWLRLWNFVDLVKFGWDCEIWLMLWNFAEIVKPESFWTILYHLGPFEFHIEQLRTLNFIIYTSITIIYTSQNKNYWLWGRPKERYNFLSFLGTKTAKISEYYLSGILPFSRILKNNCQIPQLGKGAKGDKKWMYWKICSHDQLIRFRTLYRFERPTPLFSWGKE